MTPEKPCFVITSINPCTESVRRFARLYPGLVVGDKKSPPGYEAPAHVSFLSLEEQRAAGFSCEAALPTGHYGRKNLGYLEALRRGATVIIDTDDDNYPLDNFYLPAATERVRWVETEETFFNCYKLFTDELIWPRGYPVSRARQSWTEAATITERELGSIAIWQGLVNGDPDVDAIYRLLVRADGKFNFPGAGKMALAPGVFCPFNSQNTVFYRPAFPLLYLPVTVSFRFTDILRSIVAVPLLETHGLHLGFCEATAFQERNEHDLKIDLMQELTMYVETELALDLARASISPAGTMTENLLAIYRAYEKEKIVTPREIEVLTAWLEDLRRVMG